MIPENSRYAVSIASFLVYFSTYIIILQENIGILFENQIQTRIQNEQFLLFQSQMTKVSVIFNFQINSEQISCKSFCFVVIYIITTRKFSEI